MVKDRSSRSLATFAGAAAIAVVIACQSVTSAPTPPPPGSSAVGSAVPTVSRTAETPIGRATQLVVDTDLSVDDIIALAYVLRQASLDVKAITVSGTGLVHCGPGLRVARSIANAMAEPNVPIGCGRESAGDIGHPFPAPWRAGADTGYGIDFPLVGIGQLGDTSSAPQLISDVAASSDEPVTILSLGPMTNIADAMSIPGVADHIGRVVAMAGAVDVEGNVFTDTGTPLSAEWNIYADPQSARDVLDAGLPITLIPLDATQDVPVKQEFVAELANSHDAAGADISNELFVRFGIHPGDFLWDPLAAVTLVDPSVVSTESRQLAVDVSTSETSGRLTPSETTPPIDVAMAADYDSFASRLLGGLRSGPQRDHPFTVVGTLTMTFDGAECVIDPTDTITAGNWTWTATDTNPEQALFAIVRIREGWTWSDLVHYVATAARPGDAPPFVDVTATMPVEGAGSASSLVNLQPGTYGPACGSVRDGELQPVLTGRPLEVQ